VARRFNFPLETVLNVRRLHEREAKRKLAAKRAELARLDQLDEATRGEIANRQTEILRAQQTGTVDPRDLSRGWAWIAHLRRTMQQRQQVRERELAELAKLQDAFREARRETRVIEKLRERRWTTYKRDRDRHEQAVADEMAQQLHTRKHAESAETN